MKNKDISRQGHLSPWRENLHQVIFESETIRGRRFDLIMLAMIIVSVLVAMLDSIDAFRVPQAKLLSGLEWFFTIVFTAEYVLRLLCVRKPWRYMRSFFGIVDLLTVLPSYIGLFFPSTQYSAVLRVLRLLRIFRILKLSRYLHEATILVAALKNSRRKIAVFLYAVLLLVVIFGTLIYVIEGKDAGFTSIPRGMYWAIVTLTTVGYGDIAPTSALGQFVASIMMIAGYGILAVPISIYGVELASEAQNSVKPNGKCSKCAAAQHDLDARFCKACGQALRG